MSRVRGSLLLNTISYVRGVFGDAAHERVLDALGPDLCARIASLREAAWVDMDELMAYQSTAHEILAPADAGFVRQVGYHSGRRQRTEGGFRPMLADLATATKMASVFWRSLFDTGNAVIVETTENTALFEIRDFPTSRALCLRIEGALEGALGTDAGPVRVSEESCSLDGYPHCSMRVVWLDPEPS